MDSTDRKLAGELLRIKAVLLRPDDPFTWASGWHSPIYCDNRRILSDPEIKGVFCYFGDASIGAYYGCQEADRTDIKIVGYDATAEQVDIMNKDGKDCNLIASVALFPGVMGGVCVEAAHEVLENGYEKGTPDEIVWMENGLLTPENSATFVDTIWSTPVTDWSKFGK